MLRLRYTWPTEVNGYGRAFRGWLDWPYIMPLPFNSDHGICLFSTLESHERDAPPKRFLTWNRQRFETLKLLEDKEILRIPCPWVMYRRKRNISLRPNAAGTLVFLPHSTAGLRQIIDIKDYLDKLDIVWGLPKPFLVVAHHNDIAAINALDLDAAKISIVTLGGSRSWHFIERFYSIAREFRYATSPRPGSELFYCCEMGLTYIITPFRTRAETQSKTGTTELERITSDTLFRQLSDEMQSLFGIDNAKKDVDRYVFLEKIMSLDLANEAYTRDVKIKCKIWLKQEFPSYLKSLVQFGR